MGVAQHSFEGISTSIPGVYSSQEFPTNTGAIGPATDVVTIMGEADGGVPYNATVDDALKINNFTNPVKAVNVLRGGAGLYMAEMYMRPTRDANLQKPAKCQFVRVNTATRATAALSDVSPAEIITLTSARYGTYANQLARKVEAGTTASTHMVTIKLAGTIITQVDNIGFQYMDIQYVGAGSAATMTISATQLTTSVTGAAGDNLTLLFADYPTLAQLVSHIDDHPAYTCVLRGNSDADTTTFDVVTAQNIKTAVYTSLANVEALIQFFNTQSGGELIAALKTGATRVDVVNDTTFVFCTGGSQTAATNNDWAAAFELLKKFPINHILIASGSSAIQNMLKNHVEDMSGIEERANRSAGTGASASTNTKSARIAQAKAIASARVEYHVTPFTRGDILNSNQPKVFDPFYAAALAAGIRFGNFITLAATFKTIDALAVSETYDKDTKKEYIDAGCSMLELSVRGISFVRDISTYQASNLILNTPSMLRTCDFITLDLQAKVQTLIATLKRAPDALTISAIKNTIITNFLPQYATDGYLTSDPNTKAPAFSDVEFSLAGDRFDVSFTGIVPAPLHFAFIKQKFVVVGFADTSLQAA